MEFDEDDFLQLSGLQHYIFCRRQWALIHIEGQWQENEKTIDGELFHKNAHNDSMREKRGNTIIERGIYIHSRALGLTGQCDIVEFHKTDKGITLFGEDGLWMPYPIEYKRGHEKPDESDKAQLCAQAMSLEEMYVCHISQGAIYYGERRHRMEVEFSSSLRSLVTKSVMEMHDLFSKGRTPKVKTRKNCRSCSLYDICVPEISQIESVNDYLIRMERQD